MGTGAIEQIITLSNAQFAYRLAVISRLVAMAQVSLAEGMWNPEFCAASAKYEARNICEHLRRELADIEKNI